MPNAKAALLKKAHAAMKKGQYASAIEMFEKVRALEPGHYEASLNLGLCHFNQDKFLEAAKIFHKLHEEHPEDLTVLNCCGVTYLQLGMFDLAIQFLKKYAGKKNDNYEVWVNLSCAAGKSQKNTDAAFYAMQALSLKPMEAKSHINLGGILLSMGRAEDALISFQTALTLEPHNLMALSNCASVYSHRNESEKALEIYQQCLDLNKSDPAFASDIKYRMSYELMKLGQLEKAWTCYDHGFVPTDVRSRTPKRKFPVPQWQGEDIRGKRLLVWREQGLGDELMFMPMLNDLRAIHDNIVLECDPRLVAPLQRTFPDCEVRAQAFFAPPNGMPMRDDYDIHIPLGSLLHLFRNRIEDFQKSRPYLLPCPERRQAFEQRLPAKSNVRKIGICWRSGMLSAERNKHYVALSDWAPIFELENVEFVNLQYGDCEHELRQAEQAFGVKIHRWEDLNLKDDIDGVIALMSTLDHVVSAGTAVAQLALAIGVPLSLYMSYDSWTLLGQDHYPWYPNNPLSVYLNSPDHAMAEVLPGIAHDLNTSIVEA